MFPEIIYPLETLSSLQGLLRVSHILFLCDQELVFKIVAEQMKKVHVGSSTLYHLSQVPISAQEKGVTFEQVFTDNLPIILREEGDIPIFLLQPELVGTPLCLTFLQLLMSFQPNTSSGYHGAVVQGPLEFADLIPSEVKRSIRVYG